MKARKIRTLVPYFVLLAILFVMSLAARLFLNKLSHFEEPDWQLIILGVIMFVGYIINRLAPKTVAPSFVWAIFAGIALQPFLSPSLKDISALKILMEVLAALILFAGGLEIPFKNFKRWFFPIASLSFIGVVLSAMFFALILYVLSNFLHPDANAILPSIVILSASLASTDPTAIIPTLKMLKFKRGFLKQIAISESALTDVSGSILTRFLLVAMVSVGIGSSGSGIVNAFAPLFKKSAYDALALQIISGITVGALGFFVIKKFYYTEKKKHTATDPALMLTVPVFTFVLGNVLGGAGFLAAFMSGLYTDLDGGLRKVAEFYDSFLDHLVKPFIFIVLGALVPFELLIKLAPIGILAAVLFMFVVRPVVVFISLFPWFVSREFQLRDILFLSFVRETGIIAAVLLIIASSFKIIDSDYVISVGMWVILCTLILEPPLTPYLAKKVGVAGA